jgi:replication-associated recombination protein RarA
MGKTTLAKMLAVEMNAPMKFFNASQMKIDV